MVNKQLLLNALKMLRDKGPSDESRGICSNVAYYMKVLLEWKLVDDTVYDCLEHMKDMYEKWDEFSGRRSFPIVHPDSNWLSDDDIQMAAGEAFHSDMPKWDGSTKYGQDRWALLAWLVSSLESEVADA